MLKFIEIAWTSLNSDDTTQIRNSVRLLGTIDPKYSYQLLTVLAEDSLKYGFLKDEIAPIIASTQLEVVDKLSVKIDYTSNKYESEANEIKSRLMSETKLKYGDISLASKRRLNNMTCFNVIHYSSKTDFNKIKALQNYLNSNLNSELYFSLMLNENMKQNEIILILC
ncbi:MAG: hypothetical protein COW03_00550 [Cytophagales bacterium CG12_big_fil_rev_8_21_14_0_65_40_12]|nr:MAG: hypothetical protein COW03_00550 [Cytophagales bacterium CG12_big_fil_rev_8_21_14_0_65_40_12]PIW05420.1 MAG: hypothetical protein COW40_04955 [Cytophagales bacterium CG17_big_fil_post_rev_8_21_14_2_50_40_13]